MAEVAISGGVIALVDDEDLPRVAGFRWSLEGGYAVCWHHEGTRHERRTHAIRLHRIIANAPEGLEVDHLNGDRLDNRRCNLRVVTREVNAQNRRVGRNSGTGVLGVTRDVRRGKFRAFISRGRKIVWLGRFATVEEAAAVADAARRREMPFCRSNSLELLEQEASR